MFPWLTFRKLERCVPLMHGGAGMCARVVTFTGRVYLGKMEYAIVRPCSSLRR